MLDHGLRRPTIRVDAGEMGMSFWEGETCEYCGGVIVEKRVTLHRQVHGQHILLEDVPGGCMFRVWHAVLCCECIEGDRGKHQRASEGSQRSARAGVFAVARSGKSVLTLGEAKAALSGGQNGGAVYPGR